MILGHVILARLLIMVSSAQTAEAPNRTMGRGYAQTVHPRIRGISARIAERRSRKRILMYWQKQPGFPAVSDLFWKDPSLKYRIMEEMSGLLF